MTALCLKDFRPLAQLARLALDGRLMFPLTSWRLIPPVPIVIDHAFPVASDIPPSRLTGELNRMHDTQTVRQYARATSVSVVRDLLDRTSGG